MRTLLRRNWLRRNWGPYVAAALAFAVVTPTGGQDAEGYRLSSTRVVIDKPEHWQAWAAPVGSMVVGDGGTVRPRFLRRDINAVVNAPEFVTVNVDQDTIVAGGIDLAGSNPETAANVMDGDPETYWEPSFDDEVDKWFVQIELGRSVIARQVVVRFVAAGAGDPFLKFRVIMSDGQGGLEGGPGLKFFRVAQVIKANKDQRVFTFDVKPQRPLPKGVTGEVVQVVRFEALDTDGLLGAEVPEAVYGRLGPDDRGGVEYFRQTVAGRNILIDESSYTQLPEVEKGPVRFYRRERPRLAEIEVITPGDNIVNLTQRIANQDQGLLANLVRAWTTDGFFRTVVTVRVYDQLRKRNQATVDLGARFWLDRVRLISSANLLRVYQIRLSDGSLDPAGERIWTTFDERLNRESFLQVEEQFSLREVRFVELRRLELVGSQSERGLLSEIQAYGEGYVSEVVMTSPIIQLGGSRMITSLSWEGEQPPDTRVELRSRSGDQLVDEVHYYDIAAVEITKEEWESFGEHVDRFGRLTGRGRIDTIKVPGRDWSDWSEAYQTRSEPFRSPAPRRNAMVQARLRTRDPLRAATLSRVVLQLAPPLVDQTFAEIWPNTGVNPGVDQEYTMYIKPVFQAGDDGFDRLLLQSSSSSPIEILSLHVGRDRELGTGTATQLWPGVVTVEEASDAGGVELIFPEPVTRGGQVYAARFRTRVFLSGTTFQVELTRASRPGVVQLASEGEASSLARGQTLVVISNLVDAPLMASVMAVPPVFTPNGDGVNETTQIRFDLFRMTGRRRLEVGIYDLSGRRVRDLSVVRQRPSGSHSITWNGHDDGGALVPPGIYLVHIGVPIDSRQGVTDAMRTVYVVY
jgi:hypothetical protein